MNLISDSRLAAAVREIAAKSKAQIHLDTAKTWTARAIAYLRKTLRTTDPVEKAEAQQGFDDAKHEAMEHAALTEDHGVTLRRVEREIDRAPRRRRGGRRR